MEISPLMPITENLSEATHNPSEVTENSPENNPLNEFTPDTEVIYALHGRCVVTAIETRQVANEQIRFYKLEIQKSTFSRSARQDPTIWLPMTTAKEKGLRKPMDSAEANTVLAVLANKEYYFSLDESWPNLRSLLESCIRHEGGLGLAKVVSFLFVYKRNHLVPPPEVSHFEESVYKLLLKELSSALNELPRLLDEKIQKGLRQKLQLDH